VRLPPLDHDGRLDLLEVSADFHREGPFEWMWKEATELEQEACVVFALEQHLADGLLVGLSNGVKPWSWRSRELAAGWPVASGLEFGVPPEGVLVNAGWWLHVDRVLSAIVPGEGKWTPVFNAPDRVEVTLSCGVTGLDPSAFANCAWLRRLALPPTLTAIGQKVRAVSVFRTLSVDDAMRRDDDRCLGFRRPIRCVVHRFADDGCENQRVCTQQ
jgi:hypothetical protein